MSLMKTIGYVRVSTDKQADRGVSLEAQAEKIRAMAVVHNAELVEIIIGRRGVRKEPEPSRHGAVAHAG
jgi:DNA invertase Pin-like site-specific DNA recombinase